ncbi:2-amino-4-hydroxy-6-hydroxymethyldihydropteridine diphosphokinase [Paenibacillaceae bacterium WGS1546]|uniref:2-amino-4-hydroxy-6- hydroxymethyldihydropteridine diphosphokinase n=1 Tax=Cohnella sp. WGS1546 TaxID=3366810 RepID=UPI00372D61E0
MQEAYVALGANLDDREASLREAVRRLGEDPDLAVGRVSAIYETAPFGYTEQPSFLNMVVELKTALAPVALLRRLLAIEQAMGRVREIRWGPRSIDLDLLLYGEESMASAELTLPHPRMGERAFVLVPLKDVWKPGVPFPWEKELAGFDLKAEGIARYRSREGRAPGKEWQDHA